MKLASLLFAAVVATSQADDTQRGLATLAQKWNISDPTFSFDDLAFDLTFGVSDYVKKDLGMVKYSVWDENCDTAGAAQLWDSVSGLVGQAGISVTDDSANLQQAVVGFGGANTPNGVPSGGDEMNQTVALTMTLDPNTISANTDVYSEDTTVGAVTAEIRFCVRFELHTPDYLATVVEVNFLETLITLTVDLSDGFEIGSIAVEPKDRLVRTANQIYRVRAYQCGENEAELSVSEKAETRNQGSVIKVCVTPDLDAQGDGIYMRSIDNFAFVRDSGTAGEVEQIAVENRQPALNLLTTYDNAACTGSLVCHFSTILFANFYTSTGQVDGSGVASMQFGSGNRRLRTGDRNLQEDAAAAAEFELEFDVLVTEETQSGASSIGAMFMAGLLALSGVAALM